MQAFISFIEHLTLGAVIFGGIAVFCYIRFPQFRFLLKTMIWNVIICTFAFVIALVYLISPIDIIPDPIPILGQLDDMGIVVAAFFTIPIRFIYTMKVLLNTNNN